MEMFVFWCNMFMYSVSIVSVDMFSMLLSVIEGFIYEMIPWCGLSVFLSSALIMMESLIW